MSIELLQTLAIAAYICAAVMLLVAAALFFLFNIPATIGILSGSTEKKAIENIRHQSENGDHDSAQSYTSQTGTKIDNKKINTKQQEGKSYISTSKLSTNKLLEEAKETTLLGSGGEETTVLGEEANETSVLGSQMPETTVLGSVPAEQIVQAYASSAEDLEKTGDLSEQQNYSAVKLNTELDIVFTSSNDLIE